jgi:hypothetical protein
MTSKRQLQRELNRPRATELIQGAQGTASTAVPAQVLSQCLQGITELSVGTKTQIERTIRGCEIGMVQYIEHFSNELKLQRFVDGKIPMHCKIPL